MNKPAKRLVWGVGSILALALWLAYLRAPERSDGLGEELAPAEDGSSAGAVAENAGKPTTVPGAGSPPAAGRIAADDYRTTLDSRSELLEESRSVDPSSGRGKLVRLARSPDFAFPIRIEYELDSSGRAIPERVLEMAADRVIVRLKEEIDEAVLQAELQRSGFSGARRLAGAPVYELVYQREDLHALPDAMLELQSGELSGSCAYVEPNYIVHAQTEPDDERFVDGALWGLNNLGQDGGLAGVDIDAPEGWDQRSDASSVVVAVIDTGVKYDHEDLVSNIWTNVGEVPGNGIDDDGNGFVDDVHGINAVKMDGDPMDDNGHGTHCAGTIGAEGDNGIGVVGVAWSAQLMGAKFLNSSGSGSIADAVVCVDYATRMGATVLSNSWGGGGHSQALEDAIRAAEAAGAVFVAAAGNSAADNDQAAFYPAGFTLPNVIAVASIDRLGALSSFSNYGRESVHVAAPGSDVLSCSIDAATPYVSKSGTSMAAPHVSGLLALLMAEYPEDTLYHQVNRVKQGVGLIETLAEKTAQGGAINVANSLAMVEVPFPPLLTRRLPSRIVAKEGDRIDLEVEVTSDSEVSYWWLRDGEPIAGADAAAFFVESVTAQDTGLYELVASNQDGEVRSSVEVLALAPRPELSEALDTELGEFYTYGDSDFEVYAFDSVLGGGSIRSGEIGDGEESTLFVDLQGPAEVRFQWRLSAEEHYDLGLFEVDGDLEQALASSGEWMELVYSLSEERVYRLAWTYRKDRTVGEGQDALFLDAFVYRAAGDGPPIVVTHPKGAVLAPSSDYELEVRALGSGLQYQWFFEDEAILGGKEATLALTDVSLANAGSYRATISNENGVAQSAAARIVIGETPAAIVEQPTSVVTQTGLSARFAVVASGALPISYQWFKDGAALGGETGRELVLESVASDDVGSYRVEVLNVFNIEPQTSATATLQLRDVAAGPRFVKSPVSVLAREGESHSLRGVAEGSLPIVYQWFKDGDPLEGATERSLNFDAIEESDSGEYFLRASNSEGEADSSVAAVFVIAGLEEALDLEGVVWDVSREDYFYAQSDTTHDGRDAVAVSDVGYGKTGYATLETTLQGGGNLSWRWKQDSYIAYQAASLLVGGEVAESLVGQKDWTQSFAKLPEGESSIRFRYWYSAGLKLWIDEVALDPAPRIYQQPRSQVVRKGSQATLSVDAWGAGELSYQWTKDGLELDGATDSSLQLDTNVGEVDGANYAVVVSNGHGSVTSANAKLEVLEVPESEVATGEISFNFDSPLPWEFHRDPELGVVLRSPSLEGGEEAWFETVVEGPANLVFDWKLLGEECCPWFLVTIDDGTFFWSGSQRYEGDGIGDMRRAALAVPEGAHTLRWTFEPGFEAVAGSQFAVLDGIVLTTNPVISSQPKDVTAIEGSSVTLQVKAIGTAPFSYEWRKVGEGATLSTEANLQLLDLTAATSGGYQCTVFDAAGVSVVSEVATVTALTGFHDAAGVDFGWFTQTGAGTWYPESGVGVDGGAALVLRDLDRRGVSSLRLGLEDQGANRMALRFSMKIENLPRGGYVLVSEGRGSQTKRLRVENSTGWKTFVLPLSDLTDNVVWWQAYRGVGEAGGPLTVYLDAIELVPEPVFYESPKSVATYWGEDVTLEAEVIGLEPLSFSWSRSGEAVTQVTAGSRLDLDHVDESKGGFYKLVASNEVGQVEDGSTELRVLDRSFGAAVGLPGASLRSSGDALWTRSPTGGYKGAEALMVENLGPGESSELRWQITGPGTFSFHWKLESPTDRDRMFVSFGPYLAGGLYGDSDWQAYSIDVDAASYEVSVKMVNQDLDRGALGKGWIDNIRFERESDQSYEIWSAEAFAGSGLAPELTVWDADADGDGVLNFAEYALNLNPLGRDETPQPRFLGSGHGGPIVVDFDMQAGAEDVAFGLQASRDLATWYPLAAQRITTPGEAGPRGTILYQLSGSDLDAAIHVRMCVYYLRGHE